MAEQNPTLERLEQQISWYDSKSMKNQKCFKGTRIMALVAGALVPILALIDANRLSLRLWASRWWFWRAFSN